MMSIRKPVFISRIAAASVLWRAALAAAVSWLVPDSLQAQTGAAQEGLVYREARERLLKSHSELQSLRHEIDVSLAELQGVRAAWYPEISTFAQYQLLSERSRLELELPLPMGSLERELGDLDRAEMGLDLSYTLYSGGARGASTSRHAALLEIREQEFETRSSALSLQLALLFTLWERTERELRYREEAWELSRLHLQRMRQFEEAGMAITTAVLAAEAEAALAELDIQEQQGRMDSLRVRLANLLELPGKEVTPLWEPDTLLFDSLKELLGSGAPDASGKPEIKSFSAQLQSLEAGSRAARSAYLPKLQGSAGLRYANPGLNLAGDEFMGYGMAGLRLQWRLFDGFETRSRLAALKASRSRVEVRRAAAEDALKEQWEQLVLEADRLTRERAVAQKLHYARSAQVEALAAGLSEGTKTETELLDARLDLAEAQMRLDMLQIKAKILELHGRHLKGLPIEL